MSTTISNDLKKVLNRVAAKLYNEGLTYSSYTKNKAKRRLNDVVASVYCKKLVDEFSPEIKAELKKYSRK